MQTAEGRVQVTLTLTIRRFAGSWLAAGPGVTWLSVKTGSTHQTLAIVAPTLQEAKERALKQIERERRDDPFLVVESVTGIQQAYIRRRYAVVVSATGGHTNGNHAPGHFPYGGYIAWKGDSDIERDAFVASIGGEQADVHLCEGGLPYWHHGGGPIWDLDRPEPIAPWDLHI